MTREEAIAWYRAIPETGSFGPRDAYLKEFHIGSVADKIWDSGEFTLGMEYGMMIAIVRIFDLAPRDIWPTLPPPIDPVEMSGRS